jgi:uncharacterized protein YjiK
MFIQIHTLIIFTGILAGLILNPCVDFYSPVRIGYDLSKPDKVYFPPAILHEISGITEAGESQVACVQDENGLVFIYDLVKSKIIRELFFGTRGDYEGIARSDKTIYVLRSDETLFEIKDFSSQKPVVSTFSTKIPGSDTEGLCYDRKKNRLLIVPKEISDEKHDNKGKHFIYSIDPLLKNPEKGPVMTLDIPSIERFALDNNIKIPMKGKKGQKQEPDIKMLISAIGIHPLTDRLFVISGSERILFVFDMNGEIEYLEKLDPDLFPQPEGITFMKNGDMLISNEGRNESPTIVRFSYNPSFLNQ